MAAARGPFDGLVHSAGIHTLRPLRMLDLEAVQQMLCANIASAIALAKGFAHKNVGARGGSLVFLSSAAGLAGQAGLAAYAASKGAIIALTRALAVELAGERIRVNSVAPGVVTNRNGAKPAGNADSRSRRRLWRRRICLALAALATSPTRLLFYSPGRVVGLPARPWWWMAVIRRTRGVVKRILIVGAGGFGREVLCWARNVERTQSLNGEIGGFLDANPAALDGFVRAPLKILGDPTGFRPAETDLYVCAIGDLAAKQRVVTSLLATRGARFLMLIHPSVIMGADRRIGDGCVLCPNVVLTTNVILGRFVTLNVGATVGHDVRIGDWCTL